MCPSFEVGLARVARDGVWQDRNIGPPPIFSVRMNLMNKFAFANYHFHKNLPAQNLMSQLNEKRDL